MTGAWANARGRAVVVASVLGALVAILLGAGTAAAQEAKGPNAGRISLTAGADGTSDYYFRGIVQESQADFILQPYGELTFKLLENAGPLTGMGLTFGTWNSLHWGPTGLDGPNESPKIWYESDLYTRLSLALFEDLTASAIYTAYLSPNGFFDTVQELAFGLAWNDAKILGPFALNPSVLLAFELDGQADAGSSRGTYLQFGLAPGVTLFEKAAYPLTLSFPMTAGLSLDDYYEFRTGDDDTFGFWSGGVAASVPLAFIPASFGAWQFKTSVVTLVLGDNLRRINGRDDVEFIGTAGIAFTY
ncbi:MAG: hypothetical protein HYR51_14315 [Candidatus Rokubacteria bacterium]|nr:hypothetical protein [Candidatus Rokubacteria bacterium]